MRNDALLGAMLVFAITCVVAAQETTIRIPFGVDGFDVVTFDKSRASVDDVKHWMKFAEWGDYSSFGISLSGCDQNAAVRMSKLLKQGQLISDELNRESEYPPELSPVVTYLKRALLFRLWMGKQYLAFAKTRTAPESTDQNIDAPACRVIAERIQNESDTACMSTASRRVDAMHSKIQFASTRLQNLSGKNSSRHTAFMNV